MGGDSWRHASGAPRDSRRNYLAHGGRGNDGGSWTGTFKNRRISSGAARLHLVALGSLSPGRAPLARAGAVGRALLHRRSLLGRADILQRRTGVALTRSTSLD